jgi:hypothetical protein
MIAQFPSAELHPGGDQFSSATNLVRGISTAMAKLITHPPYDFTHWKQSRGDRRFFLQ